MIVWIILLVWLIIVPTILIKSKKDLNSMMVLFLAQLYNFIVGFTSWIILFIILVVSFGTLNGGNLLFYLLIVIVFFILLIPVNIYITRKKNIDTSKYIILSILSIIFGAITCVIICNIFNNWKY